MQKTDTRQSAAAGESKLHFLDYWRVIRVRFGIVLLTFLLVVITTGVVTYFLPKKYRAQTTLELRDPRMDPSFTTGLSFRSGSGPDASYTQTQFEIMQSTDVLYPVVDADHLDRQWATDGQPMSREGAYIKLRGMLGLKPLRGTELVELSITSVDPTEAMKLVGDVAQSYSDTKAQMAAGVNRKIQGSVTAHVGESQQKQDDLLAKLQQMRRDRGIVDLEPDNRVQMKDPFEDLVNAKKSEVDKDATAIAALTSQLEQVSQLKPEDLQRAISILHIEEPTITTILPKYQATISDEALLRNSGVGPNHPKVKSLVATREVYLKQLADALANIKHTLSIQLEISKNTLVTVKQQLETLQTQQRQTRFDNADYYALKEDYLKAKDLTTQEQISNTKTQAEQSLPTFPTIVWNKPEKPSAPYSPRVPLNMTIGVLVGLLLGVGLAFFIEYLDTSVKTMEDVETMLGVPVLAIVPKNIKLLHKQPNDVPDAEAYRILRTNIEFNRKSADANTISLVSGGPGEGKSTTLSNLAFTCAQGGYSVLIVDADLRRPTQHKIFEVNNSIGLTNYLTTNIALEDVVLPTSVENLSIMPSGILPADAVGILNSQRMSDMIAELKTRYDIIFFDSPPILGVSDGAVLASEVDQSIIIVQHRRFPRAMLQRVKQAISNVGGTVLGVVLNNVDLRHDPNYAYYTSYYEYYAVRSPKDAVATTAMNAGKARNVTAGAGGKGNSNGADY